MDGRAIELRNTTYFYPNTTAPAIENINLSIDYGEFVAIAGPSGGGKSTLARIVTGLIPHIYGGSLSGEVSVDGVNVVEEGIRSIIGRIGIVLQVPENQIVNLVVEEEIAFPLENLLFDVKTILSRIEEAMNSLKIGHLRNRATNTLSGGEIQKVVLASILAYIPKIIVLDEPLAHLDPYSVKELLEILRNLNRVHGVTIVVIEHRLSELIKYVSRLIVLDRRIVFDGRPRDVLASILNSESGRGIEIPSISRLFTMAGSSFIPLAVDESIDVFRGLFHRNSECGSAPPDRVYSMQLDVDPIISARNLWYTYASGRIALKGVDIDVYRGEFIAIVGANGSGKTTLVKHFNGILKPSKGSVKVFGRDTSSYSVAELAKYIGVVFQNPLHQFFKETVLEEIMFSARNMGISNAEEKALAILRYFNLSHLADRSPYEISVGEQRRLAIASVLVYDPEAVVLDEATAGIDFSLKMELLKILTDLIKRGKTVILTTHDIEFLSYAPLDRIIVLSDGMVLAQGTPSEILYNDALLARARVAPPQIPMLVKLAGLDGCIRPLNEGELYTMLSGVQR
ncbi:MAG: ABC transporter ATP-binding protein [Ignisphaera sp.]